MCSKFSDRLFIKRNAEKLIFLFAVLTVSLVTGIACRHVEAAQRLKLQQHLAGEVLRFHVVANSDSDEDSGAETAGAGCSAGLFCRRDAGKRGRFPGSRMGAGTYR